MIRSELNAASLYNSVAYNIEFSDYYDIIYLVDVCPVCFSKGK